MNAQRKSGLGISRVIINSSDLDEKGVPLNDGWDMIRTRSSG
jgi:hypothetical protein